MGVSAVVLGGIAAILFHKTGNPLLLSAAILTTVAAILTLCVIARCLVRSAAESIRRCPISPSTRDLSTPKALSAALAVFALLNLLLVVLGVLLVLR